MHTESDRRYAKGDDQMDFWTLLAELTKFQDCDRSYLRRIPDVMIESRQIPAAKMGELFYQLGMTYTINACPAEAEQAFTSAVRLSSDVVVLEKAQWELNQLKARAAVAE